MLSEYQIDQLQELAKFAAEQARDFSGGPDAALMMELRAFDLQAIAAIFSIDPEDGKETHDNQTT